MGDDSGFGVEVGGHRFDPAEGLPKDVVEGLRGEPGLVGGRRAVIVQLLRSPTREDHERLVKLGMSLQAFVPELAVLQRLTDDELVAVRSDELVRVVVPYVAAFKLDPDIGRRRFVTEDVVKRDRCCWSWASLANPSKELRPPWSGSTWESCWPTSRRWTARPASS